MANPVTAAGSSSITADFLRQELEKHRQAFEATCTALDAPFAAALDLLERGLSAGGKLLLFGNGGSAADAQHIAAELVIRYKSDRAPIAAIALTTDSSSLTACGNDLGFDAVLATSWRPRGRSSDVSRGNAQPCATSAQRSNPCTP